MAEDVSSQEDPAGEGLAAVGADVRQRGAGPVLEQLGRGGQVTGVGGGGLAGGLALGRQPVLKLLVSDGFGTVGFWRGRGKGQ